MDMDMSNLISMMQSMGIPDEYLDRLSTDPSSVLQEVMAFSAAGQTRPALASQPNAPGSISDLIQQLEVAKAKFKRERNLPPKKVPPMTRESLSFLFEDVESKKSAEQYITRQTVVGTLAHHSVKPLADLSEIKVSDLLVRKTHKGTFLPCRIISKTRPVVGTDFVVEDSDGTIGHVSVYKYPLTLDTTSAETNAIFSVGARIAIREPTYKFSAYGTNVMIRVDSPTDIVFLDDLPLGAGSHIQAGPVLKVSPQTRVKTVEEWKATGTQAFKDGKWLQAAIAFSEGLKLDPHHQTLTLNRVETYLRIGWLHSALAEARRSLEFEGLNSDLRVKAIGRAARACYGMGKYDEASAFTAMLPENADLSKIARDCCDRIRERTTGKYDWVKLVRLSRKRPYRPDIADYTGPIEIRPSQTLAGHRGVFTTRDVRAGELLLVSKPIASSFAEDGPMPQLLYALNLSTNRVDDYCHYSLICRSVTRLWDDPELAQVFQLMYAGPDLPFYKSSVTSQPVLPRSIKHPRCPSVDIDVARVESVCSYNAFNLFSIEELVGRVKEGDGDSPMMHQANALYEYPSYCNHSCLPSVTPTFFGDAMVLRAYRNMKAGEEVTLSYFEKQKTLSKAEGDKVSEETQWGFKCTCEACLAEAADGPEVSARRTRLIDSLKAKPTKSEAKRLVSLVENSYKAAHWAKVPVKKELAVAYRTMGFEIYSEMHAKDAAQLRTSIEYLVKFMEADGVTIRVPKISGIRNRKEKPNIKIDIKGRPSHEIHCMVLNVMKISHLLRLLGDRQDRLWFKAAVMLSDIQFGGGKECFAEIFKAALEMLDCMHFLEMV